MPIDVVLVLIVSFNNSQSYHDGPGIFLQFGEGAQGPFRLGKLAWQTPILLVIVHNYVIFGQ